MTRAITKQAGRAPRGLRLLALAALVPLGLALSSGGAQAGDDELGSVESTRSALESWVDNRRLIAKAERDWKLGKQVLSDRIELLQSEIDGLRTRIEEARQDIGEADELLADLNGQVSVLEQASVSVKAVVGDIETRVAGLLARFPEPLQDNLRMLSQRLPTGEEANPPSLSQRFLTVVGILDEANRFNREVTASSEVRAASDGSLAEVNALYVGLGAAFYANAAGTAAGVGRPGPEGWEWSAADSAAAAVAEAFKVHQGEVMAHFVQLPVELDDDEPVAANQEQDG